MTDEEKIDYYNKNNGKTIEEKKLELEERKVIAFEKIAEALKEFNKIFDDKYFV